MTTDKAMVAGLSEPIFRDNNARFAREFSFGKKLLVTAWLVEILAASLGLLIAFFVSYDAYTQASEHSSNAVLNATLGALPFVLIAIIEPTKIPLALGFYRVKRLGWKILILISLLGLTTVTFETMFTGLERQLTNVTARVTDARTDILNLLDERANLETEVQELRNQEIEEITARFVSQRQDMQQEHSNRLESLEIEYDTSTAGIEQELERLRAQRDELIGSEMAGVDEEISALETQLQALNSQLASLDEQISQARLEAENDDSIQNFREIISRINAEINETSNWIDSNEPDQIRRAQARIGVVQDGLSGQNTRGNFERWRQQQQLLIDEQQSLINDRIQELEGIVSDLQETRASVNSAISELRNTLINRRTERGNLLTQLQTNPENEGLVEIASDISEKERLLRQMRATYSEQREVIVAAQQEELAALNAQQRNAEQEFNERQEAIPTLERQIAEISDEITSTERQIRSEARNNQIYRFAQKYRGYSDVLDVTEEDLSLIAAVWFGSIALICATTGTILALISNIMMDPDAFVEKQKARRLRPVQRGLRRLFVMVRKKLLRRRDTIEVEKIVEVEKVVEVEKEVEKIVEVEKVVEKEVIKTVNVEVEKFIPEIIPIPIFVSDGQDIDAQIGKANKHYDQINKKFHEIAKKETAQQEIRKDGQS